MHLFRGILFSEQSVRSMIFSKVSFSLSSFSFPSMNSIFFDFAVSREIKRPESGLTLSIRLQFLMIFLLAFRKFCKIAFSDANTVIPSPWETNREP